MAIPTNPKLYEQAKRSVGGKNSAYRNLQIAKLYKKMGGKYKGHKNKDKGLLRWVREKWTNQRGGIGYKKKGDIYRPSVRINKNTPKTWKQLKPSTIQRAREQKKASHRASFTTSKK